MRKLITSFEKEEKKVNAKEYRDYKTKIYIILKYMIKKKEKEEIDILNL